MLALLLALSIAAVPDGARRLGDPAVEAADDVSARDEVDDDARLTRAGRLALGASVGSVAGVVLGAGIAVLAVPAVPLPSLVVGGIAFAAGVVTVSGAALVVTALALPGPMPWLPIGLAASAGALGAASALASGVGLFTLVYVPFASRTTDCVCGLDLAAFIVGTGVAMAGAAALASTSTIVLATLLEPAAAE